MGDADVSGGDDGSCDNASGNGAGRFLCDYVVVLVVGWIG